MLIQEIIRRFRNIYRKVIGLIHLPISDQMVTHYIFRKGYGSVWGKKLGPTKIHHWWSHKIWCSHNVDSRHRYITARHSKEVCKYSMGNGLKIKETECVGSSKRSNPRHELRRDLKIKQVWKIKYLNNVLYKTNENVTPNPTAE